jgi:hypothetical protein
MKKNVPFHQNQIERGKIKKFQFLTFQGSQPLVWHVSNNGKKCKGEEEEEEVSQVRRGISESCAT